MEVVGEAEVIVHHNGQCTTLPLMEVAEHGPALLGRNWMRHLQLDWKAIGAVKAAQHPGCTLQAVLSKYEEVFQNDHQRHADHPAWEA